MRLLARTVLRRQAGVLVIAASVSVCVPVLGADEYSFDVEKFETKPFELRGYAEVVLSEFGKILDDDRLEIRYNSEWLAGLDLEGVHLRPDLRELIEPGSLAEAQGHPQGDGPSGEAEGRHLSPGEHGHGHPVQGQQVVSLVEHERLQ